MESKNPSLLRQLETYFGARYAWFVAGLALVLALLLALAAHAQGADSQRLRIVLGLLGLNPVIIVYILVVHPVMYRRWQRAIQSLRALAPAADGAERRQPVSHRGEWGAMLVGSILGLVIARELPGVEGWLRLYSEATSALMFALLAATIYASLARSRHLAAHSRAGLELNVFDAHLLTPFAQWGQSLSLVFVGGICLSLLFQSSQSLRSTEGVIVYGCMLIVALTLFFMSVWTIHAALARAQEKELTRVRRDLAAAREALRLDRPGEPGRTAHERYLPVVVCGIYEKQVLDASTWPFDPAIVGRVFASAVAPLSVYVLKLAFGVGAGL